MILLDLTHTSHSRARTGIQRVARALHRDLGPQAAPITRDPFLGAWRRLESWELANLANSQGGEKRRAHWPAVAKWRGRWRRAIGQTSRYALHGGFEALIMPELFSAQVAADLPRLFPHVTGPRVALFHDTIPLRFPELTPPATVARFPAYLCELLMFDAIAAISGESRDSLLGYWRWLGVAHPPPVAVIPLGVDPFKPTAPAAAPSNGSQPTVLSVGTLEGRKNHLALLEACEQLWTRGLQFQLHLVGHVNAQTGRGALRRARSLQAAGWPLRYDGPVTDEAIEAAYAGCAFTVYPSVAEGFGLPVIESLARGKPCICSADGVLGESVRGGGGIALDSVDPASLAGAIEHVLTSPTELAALTAAARKRTFKTWDECAAELLTWVKTVPRRA